MRLESDFYRNLFKTLSGQPQALQTSATGWAASAKLSGLIKQLYEELNARHVFIIEKTGKQSVSYGDLGHIDATDLVALVVGKMLACEALAGLFDSKPFSTISIEGRRWGAHFSMLDKTAILMVVFDQQTNIDLVKKRVRRACGELADAVAAS